MLANNYKNATAQSRKQRAMTSGSHQTSQTAELSAENPGKAEETLLGRGTIESMGGPCAVPRTVPSGLIFLPRMFRRDQLFCRRRSGGMVLGGTNFCVTVPP